MRICLVNWLDLFISIFYTEQSSSSSESSFPKPTAPPRSEITDNYYQVKDDDKHVYIRRIEVLLNGSPIDQVEDKQNDDECMQAYWRMFAFNGQMNSLFSNGIRHNNL